DIYTHSYTPFVIALHSEHALELSLLFLLYKANPFKRSRYGSRSAFEEAKVLGQTKTLNAISSHVTRVERPLMKVQQYSRQTIGSTIHTTFDTQKGAIQLKMSPTAALSKNDIDEIYAKYTQFFEKSKVCQTTLHHFFDEEVTGKKKFAECV